MPPGLLRPDTRKRRAIPCPGGTSDNSPTFQRWEHRPTGQQVPKGRLTMGHSSVLPALRSTLSGLGFARVQRAPDAKPGTVHDMRVNLGRCHIHVAKQILHTANVRPALKQMRRKAMAQDLRRHALVQARLACGVTHRQLECAFQEMMPALDPGMRVQ